MRGRELRGNGDTRRASAGTISAHQPNGPLTESAAGGKKSSTCCRSCRRPDSLPCSHSGSRGCRMPYRKGQPSLAADRRERSLRHGWPCRAPWDHWLRRFWQRATRQRLPEKPGRSSGNFSGHPLCLASYSPSSCPADTGLASAFRLWNQGCTPDDTTVCDIGHMVGRVYGCAGPALLGAMWRHMLYISTLPLPPVSVRK